MTALILGLCLLACPLSMLLMMWIMGRHRDRSPTRAGRE